MCMWLSMEYVWIKEEKHHHHHHGNEALQEQRREKRKLNSRREEIKWRWRKKKERRKKNFIKHLKKFFGHQITIYIPKRALYWNKRMAEQSTQQRIEDNNNNKKHATISFHAHSHTLFLLHEHFEAKHKHTDSSDIGIKAETWKKEMRKISMNAIHTSFDGVKTTSSRHWYLVRSLFPAFSEARFIDQKLSRRCLCSATLQFVFRHSGIFDLTTTQILVRWCCSCNRFVSMRCAIVSASHLNQNHRLPIIERGSFMPSLLQFHSKM